MGNYLWLLWTTKNKMALSPPPKRPELEFKDSEVKGSKVNTTLETIKDDSAFISRFSSLYNNQHFSDVVLRVDSNRYHAHRFVLITASEVFEAMLNRSRWIEATEPEVELTEEPECSAVFADFLRYLYSGCIDLSTDTVLSVLLLADKYIISVLRESCIEYMLRHIVESPDTNRTLTWFHYAKMTEQQNLREACITFIQSNFDVILDASDWTEMTKEELVEFLQSSELIVKSEVHLWKQVEKWLMCDYNKGCIEENLKDILPLLRFSMILPKDLLMIEASSISSKYHELFTEKINLAYRHHSLMADCGDLIEKHEKYRNYYNDDYGISFPFKLDNYQGVNKIDSQIKFPCRVPSFHMSPSRQSSKAYTEFTAYFYPCGFFTTITLYGTYINRQNEGTTLRLSQGFCVHEAMKVYATLILYGRKNGVRYVAYTHSSSHVFSKGHGDLRVTSVIDVQKLLQEDSPFLDSGTLSGRLFIKIQDTGSHLLKVDARNAGTK